VGVLVVAAGACLAQPTVPRVTFDNPVAGLCIDVPEDWEMGTSDFGWLSVGIEAGLGASQCAVFPDIWFFFTRSAPAQEAKEVAQAWAIGGAQPQIVAGPKGSFEVRFTSQDSRGPLNQRWSCRRQGRVNYVIATMVRPQFAAQFQGDLDTALASAHLVPGPPLQLFTEPSERAYRMIFPQGWQWEGRILRTPQAPGVFQWKVQTPDRLNGAFNAPPVSFNIAVPYQPASACAQSMILPALRQEVPDLRLDGVHELPRAGQYFTAMIKAAGLGANPRVDKCRAEYTGTRNGTAIRIHCDIGTMMLDASPLLGGRGNWTLFVSGYWAPAQGYAVASKIGRGVVCSISTDPQWKENQRVMVKADRWWKEFMRDLNDHKFIEDYLGRSYNDMPSLRDSDLGLPPW
jgi:hypothetical protein